MNFHSKHPTGARSVSPQTLIQKAFDDADGDRQTAAKAVVAAAKTNSALTQHLVDLGARTAVGNLICSDRAKIFTGNASADVTRPRYANMKPQDDRAHRQRVAGRVALELRMLDATLFGGKIKMMDATHEDLVESASKYSSQSKAMNAQAVYQTLVAARVPPGGRGPHGGFRR